MEITPFAVEQWMNEYENHCDHNLAETCVESLTVGQLLEYSGTGDEFLDQLRAMKLTYGAIEGSERLRTAAAALYEHQDAGNILVTHGAAGANHLVHHTLVEPGDHVVTVLPTYQQHYSIPASVGADVQQVHAREQDDWLPRLDELAAAITPGTRLVVLTNPGNPTGALMDRDFLEQVVALCEQADAWLLCDEVYRGLDQDGPGTTASVADLYRRGVATSSMSKAFSLAGLRLGWVVAPHELVHQLTIHRDYSTISVGMVDDLLACLALEHAEPILARNRGIVRGNLATLSGWVEATDGIEMVRPGGGTTALLPHDLPMGSREFCIRLLEETGVMLTPGSALDVEGHLRIGYANNPEVLAAGLPLLGDFVARHRT